MSLKGKTLFITGASRGIGLAIALRAARDGANIAVAAKTETPHASFRGREFEKPSGAGRRPGGCHQRGASSDLAGPLFRRLSAPAY